MSNIVFITHTNTYNRFVCKSGLCVYVHICDMFLGSFMKCKSQFLQFGLSNLNLKRFEFLCFTDAFLLNEVSENCLLPAV